MNCSLRLLPRFLMLMVMVVPCAAQAEDSAKAIVQRSIEKRQVRNSIQTLTMTIEDLAKDGTVRGTRTRTIETKVRDDDDAVRSHIRFVAPADMAGIQFVSITPDSGSTEQFMYYPPPDEMLNRISGSGRSGSFFGSNFSFEDMEISSADDAEHKLLGEETLTIGGASIACWKIESTPHEDAKSTYGKIISWIAKDNDMPRQVLFFDRKMRELKKMTILEVKKDGSIWLPIRTQMEGIQRPGRTQLVIDSYRTNVPTSEIPSEIFTEAGVRSAG